MYYDIVAGVEVGNNAAVSMLSNTAGRLESYSLNSEYIKIPFFSISGARARVCTIPSNFLHLG